MSAETEMDRRLQAAQAGLLAQHAPDTHIRRVRWSRGHTQVLEAGDGPPVLLIHGGLDNAFVWVPILQTLARSRHVLAVDLPGHGLADPFDYSGEDLLDLARTFLRDILDGLELPSVDLVGCSVGGLWSVVFAIDDPDRVSRLAIVGAPPGVTRSVPNQLRLLGLPLIGRPLGRLLMSNPTREGNRKFLGQVAVVHPENLTDEQLDADVASQRRNIGSHLSLMSCLIGPGGVRRRLILGERWQSLSVPTLFLLGERDAFVPPKMEKAWEAIIARNPNIRMVRIPGAGHLAWLDAPEHVVREIERFLAA
ncbi:MAG TPA: alpha/beta hydrolase [Actinomycetota bacterium]|nr:alpha/beta hydrolase [Actinomycetota bacterium]